MEQNPSRRIPQGQEQVPRPRVVRARTAMERSFDASSESYTYEQNPGRAPVQSAYARDAAGAYRQGTRAMRQREAGDGYGGGYDSSDYRGSSKRRKNSHPFLYATVIMFCTLGLAAIGVFMAPQLFGIHWKDMPNYAFVNGKLLQFSSAKMEEYKSRRSFLSKDTIYPGVYIDNVHVGSMTVDQARAAIGSGQAQGDGGFNLTVRIGNQNLVINNQTVPLTRNVDQVLEQAYAYGRQNTADIVNTRVTPFEQRLSATEQLYQNNVYLTSAMSYDKAAVRQLTDTLVNYVNRAPIDATVQSFDFTTKSFTFADEANGYQVDGEALYQQVIAKLDAKEYGQTLTFTPEVIAPKITKLYLMNNFKRVSYYVTETTSNANRNTNVELSSKAINGRTVMPGEVFSFNQTTGQRTEAKGYKEAIAISGGQTVPDIGGGVCQTSGTLFNAIARADLEVVYRSPHAWPSTYVTIGQDATVNWPDLDFRFRNNKETPIFIISWYKDRKIAVEIYGLSLGDGVTIELESDIVKTIRPPSDVKYVQNTNLAPGTSKQTIESRTGYVVDTYKVWYRNGQEFKREKMYTSNYKSYQRTVEYN